MPEICCDAWCGVERQRAKRAEWEQMSNAWKLMKNACVETCMMKVSNGLKESLPFYREGGVKTTTEKNTRMKTEAHWKKIMRIFAQCWGLWSVFVYFIPAKLAGYGLLCLHCVVLQFRGMRKHEYCIAALFGAPRQYRGSWRPPCSPPRPSRIHQLEANVAHLAPECSMRGKKLFSGSWSRKVYYPFVTPSGTRLASLERRSTKHDDDFFGLNLSRLVNAGKVRLG